MTLGKLALRSLTLSVVSACILIAASAPQLRFYEDLETQASKLIKVASKINPVIVNDADLKSYAVPPGPAVRLLVFSDPGKPLRMLYFQHRALKVVDHIGEGNEVVRRDLYHEERVRVRQFFDQEKSLTQVDFLDTKGKILQRKETPGCATSPGVGVRMKKTARAPSTRAAFAALLITLFFSNNILVIHRVQLSFNLLGWVYAWLLELSLFALAYDISEVVLCLICRETHLPSLPLPERHPSVALLCVTCDDAEEDILLRLSHQDYPNLEIFILDDSQRPESRQVIDQLGLNVLRRKSRDGYKAGNLNNWLSKNGSGYDYFVVADADSILPESFVSEMVRVAEHPDNRQLAIIESMIYPWNDKHPFVKPQSIQAPFQRCRRLRLLNRLDSTLSVGHNNIYRTSAILEIGGFQESYIAEDYATTIDLFQKTPWKCKTASVKSYERLPANISEYTRRQSRWSYQTFQLCSMNTHRLPWETRLALLRALYHFFMPITAYMAMLWLIAVNMKQNLTGPKVAFSEVASSFVDHPAFVFWLSWLMGPTLLRLALLRREGVPLSDCIRSTFFQAALFSSTAWPVIRRLAGLLRPHYHRFDVTGRSPNPRLWDSIKLAGPGLLLSWITLLSFIPAPLHAMLNATWLIPACFSPFLLHRTGGPDHGRWT